MKKIIAFIALSIFTFNSQMFAGGFEVKLTVKGLKDTTCQLAYYFGEKQYIKDSARVDKNGVMIFKGEEELPGGIYLAVMPNKRYFELIIDKEQKFSMETDTADYINNMKVKNSKDNEIFYEYLKWISIKGKSIEALKAESDIAKDDAAKTKEIKDKQIAIDKEVKEYKLNFIKQNPASMLAKVFEASTDPEIPEAPLLPNGKKDSTFAFRYYKAHYFDKIDMKDDRLLRSPVFGNKIKQYLERLTAQIPDSINAAADKMISLTNPTGEIFKYLVYYITNTYEKSNIMGMDAVFVYMAKNYYLSGKAYWVEEAQQEKICDRVKALDPCLIGRKANNMRLLKNDFHPIALSDIKTKYTIVYFWDPSCGHCQKVTPQLKTFYDKYKKDLDVEVLGVYIEADTTEWFKYIKEKELNWINAADLLGTAQFRKYYDIYSTPVAFLLDNEKRIIAKRIEVEQLEDFIKNHSQGKVVVPKLPDLIPFPCKPSDPSKEKSGH
jgi:thiol-disulfide isomerase/thioredoxin